VCEREREREIMEVVWGSCSLMGLVFELFRISFFFFSFFLFFIYFYSCSFRIIHVLFLISNCTKLLAKA
jgi:hypothetical protein